jgi:Terminase large subunit, T4likevirus-type, N-terminal
MTASVNLAQPRTWKPTQRQADFISLPDTIFEALYGGSAGSGKSDILMMLPLVKKAKSGIPLYEHPRFKMLFLRRTYPELDSEIIPRSQTIYPAFGFNNYQDQKKRWTHPSGAIIQFGHCEHEKDVRKYDTSEYNIICFDEATSFTAWQYEYLTFSRCRSSSSDLPAIVRAGTNPGNISHGYFRDRFVKPARDGNVVLREERKNTGTTLRIFIPAKATDNTYLLAADPDYINRLNRLPAAERAAKADGDWWTFSGQVFDEWREQPLLDEPANARHVIQPFAIPEYWPKVLAGDWGFSAMTIFGWYAINPLPSIQYPAKIYKYREYSCTKTKITSWAADIARLSQGENYADVVLDPSAWGERGDELSITEQFSQTSGLKPRRADNNRISGKLLMQDLLRWKPRPARYVPQDGFDHSMFMEINRKRGPQAAEEYASLFRPEAKESFLPQFQVFDCCKETIKAIPLCVYKTSDKYKEVENNPEGNTEDVAEFAGDDPYDETRYGLKACQLYLDGGKEEHAALEKRAQVCSTYERTGNTNQFYMQMGNLEAREGKQTMPTRRFHRRLNHANF